MRLLLAALVGSLAAPVPGLAQDVRPGDERPELPGFETPEEREDRSQPILPLPEVPDFEPPERKRGSVLPPLELPRSADTRGLQGGARVLVRAIEIHGNTVLDEQDLDPVARPYLGRALSFADLETLRDELTLAYVSRGYVTSGATIPSQSLEDGVLEVRIVEGQLAEIRIESEGRFREGYLRRRIALGAGPPVNVLELEERLQILQQDDRIRAVHASLLPGDARGEAVLRVAVEETSPWRLSLGVNDYSSPALGGLRGEVAPAAVNLTGWGDVLRADYKASGGLHDIRASYEVPFTARDTRAQIYFRRTWSEVVEAPFDVLEIESETATYGFTLSQPVYRSLNTQAEVFLTGEYRKSESFLLGEPFSFVIGPINGVGKETVLRLGGSWTWRTGRQVLAARSLFSFGLQALGATQNPGNIPDGQYFSWLGQLQWAGRLPWLDSQLVARADVQLADRPLLGIEQFAIGGHATVRGYRENALVRDNGVVGSVEWRIPVPLPSWREWRPRFELAPFVDAGYSWNAGRPTVGPRTLVSVGIGGRFQLTSRLRLQVYWGEALTKAPTVDGHTLQDLGLHLGMRWDW